jgi:hypothetical protein
VLGELITIIEEDKRGVLVTLPYSKTEFSVPGNLWIVGMSCTRFPWTAICPTGDRHDEVQHGPERSR